MADSDAVTRLNAALEGRYRIERELGKGGMATVYLADDLRHGRNVALKVLKPELAAVVGAERFLAEIQTTANLQHPHILPLFDSGEASGFLFYVMPYVEGESLRQKLGRERQLQVDDAVRIATAVANALDYAHRQGVVHRDIKPANILLHDGEPVVADFGIALAVNSAAGHRLTETGLSLGTPHYMSPEQATGDPHVGSATDIWALGCVLYEMLVGEPPYTGSTPQGILGRIITGEAPSANRERRSVPPGVDAAIGKALEKLPADRFTGAKAFAEALADPTFRHGPPMAQQPAADRVRKLPWAAALVLTSVAALWGWMRPETAPPVVRFRMALAEGQEMEYVNPSGSAIPPSGLAISPSGSSFVYTGPAANGTWQLWRRDFADLSGTPIPGTAFGINPFFSPDGTRIGFTQRLVTLRVAPLSGGLPITVADSAVGPAGVTWAPNGTLYADGQGARPLYRLRPAANAIPEQATTLDPSTGETNHRWPDALPNGRGVLFTVDYGGGGADDLAVLDLERGTHTILITDGTYPRYSRSGHILYVTSDNTLMAVPFDEDALSLAGDPVAIVSGVAAGVTISNDGTLMYATATASAPFNELVWVDRTGAVTPLESGGSQDRLEAGSTIADQRPALSPDGTRIAITRRAGGPAVREIWIKNLTDGSFYQFTSGGGGGPAWSHDGRLIAFNSERIAMFDLFVRPANGEEPAALLQDGQGAMTSVAFSPDGRWFAYNENRTVYASELGATVSERRTVVPNTGDALNLAISPSGRWIAYELTRDGASELAITPSPFSDVSAPILPVGQGSFPVWSPDGDELFYRTAEGFLVTRSVSGEASLVLGAPQELFSTEGFVGGFDVDRDAHRFLMLRRPPGTRPTPNIVVMQNFFEELKRLFPD